DSRQAGAGGGGAVRRSGPAVAGARHHPPRRTAAARPRRAARPPARRRAAHRVVHRARVPVADPEVVRTRASGRGARRSGRPAGGTRPHNLPPLSSEALAPLRELLADPRVPKAGHNIKYDWLVLRRAGVELAGVSYDSMLASFVLDPGRRSHALDELARER